MKEIKLTVNKKYESRYKGGYPLLMEGALKKPISEDMEGAVFSLFDEAGKFISRGYIGFQNKGVGWVLSRTDRERFDGRFFESKLRSAREHRSELLKSKDTTCFRLFNGEGDGVGGLTIDWFEGHVLISWYSRGIYEFKDGIVEAVKAVFKPKSLYQKKRFGKDGTFIEESSYLWGEKADFPLIVKESGASFAVDLDDGAMVGVFLDQRDVRRTIRDKYAKGRTVLNTFSYTGAFSVFAALGGASKTTSVDLANRSRPKTIEQFSVNMIDYEAHDIIVEDVFNYFKYAVRKGLKFDMVILDPPSFAKSKKFRFSAHKDYVGLMKEAIAITSKGGIIVSSTNCSLFDMKRFKEFIKQAYEESGIKYKQLEEFSLPKDFRTDKSFKEGDYLKVVFTQVM